MGSRSTRVQMGERAEQKALLAGQCAEYQSSIQSFRVVTELVFGGSKWHESPCMGLALSRMMISPSCQTLSRQSS